MKIETVELSKLKPNDDNPRLINNKKFKELVQSLSEFSEMSEAREIVVNEDYEILGGNMRFRAMQELGWETCKVKVVDWSEEKQREFVIKDNVSGGDWDWETLAEKWASDDLERWGLNMPIDDVYTRKIEVPKYEPVDEDIELDELVDTEKADELIREIESSDLSDEQKEFLKQSAYRHLVFDYGAIAKYYANADEEMQNLMEKSALVIIDYDRAIELGYVQLTQAIADLEDEDYGE